MNFVDGPVDPLLSVSHLSDAVTRDPSLRSCDFEVFGTVQKVYFRQHTQDQAKKLNLVGWVKNTERKTVQGHMEGEAENVDRMKMWLQKTGSPKSTIAKAEFQNEKSIDRLTSTSFEIQR